MSLSAATLPAVAARSAGLRECVRVAAVVVCRGAEASW
jgi:hypothetical protein